MEVNKTTVVELSEADVREAVVRYLKDKGLIKETQKTEVCFDVSKTREGEDLFSPGYDVLKFNGCNVTVTNS